MSALAQRIIEAIRINGPMPVSLYMLMCLHDPGDGYYATRPGFNHDFTTAPETSQVFGELLGLWVAHEWMRLGSPPKFWLVELGPGRGAMMADMLRAAGSVKGFNDAVQVALVEASPALRKQQNAILARHEIHHFDELGSVPPGPSIIIANEFLDCLAIRQFVREGNGWRERQVGLDRDGHLVFGAGPPADLPADVIPVGDHVEVAPALETLIGSLAARFRQHPGHALLIDYGPDDRSPDDTLRAYSAGTQIHPLAQPGLSDLTADVDFPRLRKISESEGLAVHGPIQQRYFLTRLGAKERAEALIRANPQRADEIRRGVEELVSPNHMGARFKCVALTPYGVNAPPGF
ncbi:MAG: SAM-dependent methyltransferase [Hyphomonadaceae bacterium]|nr:SAM-dependent methyltransferase [Hyphomonadaceae bacterium]